MRSREHEQGIEAMVSAGECTAFESLGVRNVSEHAYWLVMKRMVGLKTSFTFSFSPSELLRLMSTASVMTDDPARL
jgi:hypothetical protein